MKMNWGTGIAIFLGLFMTFILTMVVKAHQIESDLYAEDYYSQEVNYQGTIDAISRGNIYSDSVEFRMNEAGNLEVYCPVSLLNANELLLHFYRPDNASLDRNIKLSNQKQSPIIINGKDLVRGRYTLELTWKLAGEDYQIAEELYR